MRFATIALLVLGLLSALPSPVAAQLKKEAKPTPPAKDNPAGAEQQGPPSPEDKSSAEEKALKALKLPTDGPGLIEFFHKRSDPKVDDGKLNELVRQLSDPASEVRDKAFGELVSLGSFGTNPLRQAANDLDDPDRSNLARQCLQAIEGSSGASLTGTAARMLAELKPLGAVEALLAYLPFAEDETATEEISAAVKTLALRDGKLDEALIKALKDPLPVRRAFAAEVLCKIGGPEQIPAVRDLLKDPKPSVRLRAALALAQYEDVEAVPILIGLLGDLPEARTHPAEEFLTRLAGDWELSVPRGDDEIARRLRRDAWAAWWKSTDGPTLLEQFRKRTLSDADRDKGLALIGKLNDPAARDQALTDLLTLGDGAIPLLRQAANTADGKSRERIQKCLQLIDNGTQPPLPTVAARLLAMRKPPGAADALLSFLPQAEDEAMMEEVRAALVLVAQRDGKADPALVKALQDKNANRRATAAETLCFVSDLEAREAAMKLMEDPDLSVRLRVAHAALDSGEKKAIPFLIGMLAEGSREQAEQILDSLYPVAEDKVPSEGLGEDEAARKKCQSAWQAWWKDNGDKVTIAKLDPQERVMGYTLIAEGWDQVKQSGRVVELDARGKVRWQIENLQFPMDAQVVPGNKVLIAEHNAGRVSERDLKGTILWQRNVNQPRSVDRLSNGHTLIAACNEIVEVDRAGKDVFSYQRPGQDIMAAKKLRNGQYAIVLQQGYIRIDATKKEVKNTRLPPVQWWLGGGIEILPNDHVLMVMNQNNKVVEYDDNGKEVWSANVPWPTAVTRLPNGRTLVGSQNSGKLVEVDRAGKVTWESKDMYRANRIRRR
jgi:HEAT repeat protein